MSKALLVFAMALVEMIQFWVLVRSRGGDVETAIAHMSLEEYLRARAHVVNFIMLCNLSGILGYLK